MTRQKPTLSGGAVQVVSVAPTTALKAYTKQLADRADAVRAGLVHPREDNLLKVTSDGRKASAFNGPPLTWPAAPDRTKVDLCADRIFSHYVETDGDRGAQLVFCDLYTPKASADEEFLTEEEQFAALGVYGRLRDALTTRGVLSADVAFAHDHRTPRRRAALHKAIRSGEIRVCVGSTALIGVAVNVQDRGVALHNLDCPWRPDGLEQRLGRLARQGNAYETVSAYVYVTEGSYDPVVWQIIEGKARWIAQVSSGRAGRREVDDLGVTVLTAAMARAVAVGDRRVVDKVRLENELAGLERRFEMWRQSRVSLRRELEETQKRVEVVRSQIEALARCSIAIDWAEDLRLYDANGILGVSLTVQQGDEAVRRMLADGRSDGRSDGSGDRSKLGTWRGLDLWIEAGTLVARPRGMMSDGVRIPRLAVSRPISALAGLLRREALDLEVRLLEAESVRLSARSQAASTELDAEWAARPRAEELLTEYDELCSKREDGLEELQDRASFKFA